MSSSAEAITAQAAIIAMRQNRKRKGDEDDDKRDAKKAAVEKGAGKYCAIPLDFSH